MISTKHNKNSKSEVVTNSQISQCRCQKSQDHEDLAGNKKKIKIIVPVWITISTFYKQRLIH